MRLIVLSLIAAAALLAQPPADAPKPRGPRQPPKNLKIIKQPEQLMPIMRAFTASLGVECSHCHVQGAMDSDEKPQKVTARKMMEMTAAINEHNFDGKMRVTCFTCHRGAVEPAGAPPMPAPQAR